MEKKKKGMEDQIKEETRMFSIIKISKYLK